MKKTELIVDTKKVLSFFAISFVFIVFTVWFSSWITQKPKEETPPVVVPQATTAFESVICPRDISAFNLLHDDKKQYVDLISEPKPMFATGGRFINSQVVITKNETKESKVACGYILIKAHNDKGALQSWENLYINPNNFGGHIDKNNQFGLGDGNEFSEYLFLLSDIKYWKTRSTKGAVLEADWGALLNVSETVSFEIALNSQNRTGVIDKVSIAYKCWNPQTGKETDGCKLNIVSKQDKSTDSIR